MLSRDNLRYVEQTLVMAASSCGRTERRNGTVPGPSVILAPNTETTENTSPIKGDVIKISTRIDIKLVTAQPNTSNQRILSAADPAPERHCK